MSALAAINRHVLHRDLKPQNIFIGEDQVRVSDFGLAKYIDQATRSRTFKGWGTAAYLSPEAWRESRLDWRSDQYALGVIFFEMAALQRPFPGPDDVQEQKHLYERPPRLDALVPGFPTPLASAIARMLEKRPEERFASWEDLSSQLGLATAGASSGSRTVHPLAKRLVERVDAHRRQDLEQAKAEETRTRIEVERRQLAGYWRKEFSAYIVERFDSLNAQAADKVIKHSERNGKLKASILDNQFEFFIEPVSPEEAGDVAAWGLMQVRTPHRSAVCNMLLLREPVPYGRWMQASMQVSGLASRPIGPSDLVREGPYIGARYEVLGQAGIVVALNWTALAQQRAFRNVVSLVNYEESELEFRNDVEQCLEVLVSDA